MLNSSDMVSSDTRSMNAGASTPLAVWNAGSGFWLTLPALTTQDGHSSSTIKFWNS